MKKLFIHRLSDSFRMFFEHELLDKGNAFRNVSGLLYPVKDKSLTNKSIYSNPYGQWVYDSSISGANVPSGVYANNIFVPRGTGTFIDFERGRVISNSQLAQNVTASYAVKDFNIYSSTKTDAEILYTMKQGFRQEFNLPATGLPYDNVYGPSIFLRRDSFDNDPFAFGGQDNSVANFRAVVFTKNEYDLDAVGSIFTDSARKNFMLLDNPPLNRYGDIITGNSYNYLNDVSNNYDSSKLVHISESSYYRFSASTETSLGNDFRIGFIEFKTEISRFPRL